MDLSFFIRLLENNLLIELKTEFIHKCNQYVRDNPYAHFDYDLLTYWEAASVMSSEPERPKDIEFSFIDELKENLSHHSSQLRSIIYQGTQTSTQKARLFIICDMINKFEVSSIEEEYKSIILKHLNHVRKDLELFIKPSSMQGNKDDKEILLKKIHLGFKEEERGALEEFFINGPIGLDIIEGPINNLLDLFINKDLRTVDQVVKINCATNEFAFIINSLSQVKKKCTPANIEKGKRFLSAKGNFLVAGNLYTSKAKHKLTKEFKESIYKQIQILRKNIKES